MSTLHTKVSSPQTRRANLALIATIAIPAFAIAASLLTVGIAVMQGDRELPEQYHWEGFKLDRDFERFQRAMDLNVQATLAISADERVCRLTLQLNAAPPEALDLTLVHATLPQLDRKVHLWRMGNEYWAACDALPAGSWRVHLHDPDRTWEIRQHVSGSLTHARLAARTAE